MKQLNKSKQLDNSIFDKKIFFAVSGWFILISIYLSMSSYPANALTFISACGNITASGDYALNQNIASAITCLFISTDNVSLDCSGFTIFYDTGGTTTRMGIDVSNGTTARTNVTIQNCNIIKPSNLQTAGYGIRLSRFSDSRIYNNSITTNGTNNNFGILLSNFSSNNIVENNSIRSNGTGTGNVGIFIITGSNNNTVFHNYINTSGTSSNYGVEISGAVTPSAGNDIISNTIFTSGSVASNYGIFLTTYTIFTNVSGNNITTNGTTTNHGIYLAGLAANPTGNNTISSNQINTYGTAAAPANYGVILQNLAGQNSILNNNISTHGAATNYGVYITGTAALPVNANVIDSNDINTNGTTTDNYGVYIFTNGNYNNVTDNTISTAGSTLNYGVQISGSTFPCTYNLIALNNISTSGTGASNFGVYLFRNADSNSVIDNIIFTNGTTTNYGIYALGNAALDTSYNLIDSNVINVSGTGANPSNIGVILSTNADSNNVTNNNITTSGTTGNYGVQIVGTAAVQSNSNLVDSNIINTRGTTTNNYGVYLFTSVNMNTVSNNIIRTLGTTGGHGIFLSTNVTWNNVSGNDIMTNGTTTDNGIYLVGAANAPAGNNIVSNNTIQTFGTAVAITSIGIELQNNADNNLVADNNVSTHGTTGNNGIYIFGTPALNNNYNVINNNDIDTHGTTTNNYGIYLLTNADFNNVTGNNITTNGSTGNVGIAISGTNSLSTGNIVSENTIRAFGTTGVYGLYINTNSNQNILTGNDLITNGTFTNYGIYLFGAANAPVNNNLISYNSIQTRCATAVGLCHAIYFNNLAYNNTAFGNNITTGGTLNNYGICFAGTAVLPVFSNIIDSNILNVSKADRINIGLASPNNTIINNQIVDRDYSRYDFNISTAGVNGTQFVNQYIENYTITGSGGLISVQNTNFGEIDFLVRVNGSGSNFSKDINISYDYIFVNSTKPGLNKTANLTLYNLTFYSPKILRDNLTCNDCVILSYVNGMLIFNVSHFSSYSADENATIPPNISYIYINDSILPENEIILSAGSTRAVTCYVSVSDPLGIGNINGTNATFYYYLNKTDDPDNNFVHYTNDSCSINDTNSTNIIYACSFNVWYYAYNGTWYCNATAVNNQSLSVSANISTVIDTLYAINLTNGLSFQSVQTGVESDNMTVNITNFGNVPMNITIQGYAKVPGDNISMNCTDGTNLSIDKIRYGIASSFAYSQKTPLNGSYQFINLTLDPQLSISTQTTNITYWQIKPDALLTNKQCEGYIIFSGEAS